MPLRVLYPRPIEREPAPLELELREPLVKPQQDIAFAYQIALFDKDLGNPAGGRG